MINIGKILDRAWRILWNYRVLWIFGVLLAMTIGGGANANFNYQFSGDEWNWRTRPVPPEMQEFGNWLEDNLGPLFLDPEAHISTIIWISVGFLLFILVVSAIAALIRYPSETAVLRMVNGYEETGSKVNFSQGWRMGWSRSAFRLWVIDLVLAIPGILISLIVVAVVFFGIYFSMVGNRGDPGAFGIVAAITFIFLLVFLFIIAMVILGLLREFISRKVVLENYAIGESFLQGWKMFTTHWKSALLFWLVIVGLGIAAAILGFISFFLLIPLYIVLLIPALLVGAIPGLIAFAILSLFTSGPLTWIIGILFGLPLFFAVLFLPLSLLTGWYRIFISSAWTLAYREMKVIGGGQAVAGSDLPEKIE